MTCVTNLISRACLEIAFIWILLINEVQSHSSFVETSSLISGCFMKIFLYFCIILISLFIQYNWEFCHLSSLILNLLVSVWKSLTLQTWEPALFLSNLFQSLVIFSIISCWYWILTLAEPCSWHPVTEISSSNGDQMSRNLHTWWWKQIQFLKHFCLETPEEMANVQNKSHFWTQQAEWCMYNFIVYEIIYHFSWNFKLF